jgi:hypothetical protein
MATKLVVNFRRGKRDVTFSTSSAEALCDSAELEIHFDKKNPVSETEFLKIVAQLRYLLNKMGTSILDASYKGANKQIASATRTLERKHEEQDEDGDGSSQ